MLKKISGVLFVLCFFITSSSLLADTVVWKGQVSADGTPSKAIDMTNGKKYQIIVSGSINLGKWVQAGQKLADDPAFEYNAPTGPVHLNIFRNSHDIPFDVKTINPEHIYKSLPFLAKQNKIHFWVNDTDYSDNSGAFDVQLVQID